ncbi:uncharacterized protein TNCV_2775881 [Trichonephila clavipes]|nr:uncharacterized protein TNCV_2775881 [Trichonephila clavipes]
MAPHTITLAVGAVCRCKAKAGLRRSPRGLHTRTRLSSLLRLDSLLKMTWSHSATLQFPHARHLFKRRRRWVGVKGSTRNGRRDPKCPSARRVRMVREDTGAPSEGATCAWMAADEAFGYTCISYDVAIFSTTGLSRASCVNHISRIHWSQHLLITQTERPN